MLPEIRGEPGDAETMSDTLAASLDRYYALGARFGCWSYE